MSSAFKTFVQQFIVIGSYLGVLKCQDTGAVRVLEVTDQPRTRLRLKTTDVCTAVFHSR